MSSCRIRSAAALTCSSRDELGVGTDAQLAAPIAAVMNKIRLGRFILDLVGVERGRLTVWAMSLCSVNILADAGTCSKPRATRDTRRPHLRTRSGSVEEWPNMQW